MAFVSRILFAALAGCLALDIAAAAEAPVAYKLSPGDTVEIGIASIAERTQRAIVQMDGSIALPEFGMIPVGGLTPAELQTRMEAVLPTKIVHQRLPDGREQMIVIKPSDVTAVIAEYRPIYVTGDVLTPGQQTYRPLMTVRQAIAVAGGFSLLRSRASQSGPDPVDLRRDYESIWGDYIRDYFHGARIRAELQNQAEFDMQPPQGSPLSNALISAVAQAEAEGLKISLNNFQQEQSYLDKTAKDAEAQVEVLLKREQTEAAAVKQDEDDLARVTKSFESGNLTNSRLADVRRAVLMSSSRALETSVELMRTRRQQEDSVRQQERNENQRRIGLLNELRDTDLRLAETTARLHAASQKLQPSGASALPLPIAGETFQARITITGGAGDASRGRPADQDTEVAPGDTIEVRFSSELQSAAIQ
ncbi:sugar ABC transporter substrate-binding protein [Mesorhizobium sp. M7A.F.Ca.CA.001.09.2.1]|uniref:Polysaccharide export protein n=3 Tax=Mesorhizobium TaxID=68287 RepID=A0AB38TA54_9HYPH|nr:MULTISPECIES: polysaccharide biosynthesis/export family protein [Mesorhizobium]RUY80756.1 sugar ABC transporter substrate-binding protein [Mesorhizobium sp. M7A.F.Ca.CA.001.09.2.1]RVA70159.1 sugar ABC transporter substrate-binding protein [Mesorhizobium sp. M7A.F.Ca.CA.001.08.1.1]RVA79744.1 sugar ABC transporter substrate-binding protein [Mesorhizobium sp. M7A.F.Ca.CA.001.11.2.1]MDF3214160.1 polysaccharide export protein [Mesorhizobium ciceri]RUY72305.1 sugar ABC transporter substrate-bindi